MDTVAEQIVAEYFDAIWWGEDEPAEHPAEILYEEQIGRAQAVAQEVFK